MKQELVKIFSVSVGYILALIVIFSAFSMVSCKENRKSNLLTDFNKNFYHQDSNKFVNNYIKRFPESLIKIDFFKMRDLNPADSTEATDSISFLFLGNSFTRDAVCYAPFLLNTIAPEVNYRFGILYFGGCSLQQHFSFLDSSPYEFNYIDKQMHSWSQTDNFSFRDALSEYDWDIVVFQQQSNASIDYTTYQPYLNDLIDYVRDNGKPNCRIGWLLTPSFGENFRGLGDDTSDSMFYKTSRASKQLLQDTSVDFIIPAGTAIQNARTNNVLKVLGATKYLNYDGRHLQEGLPCQIEAYVVVLKVFELLGLSDRHCIFQDRTIVDYPWLSSKNIPEPNGYPVVSDPYKVFLGQKAAYYAIKDPFNITQIDQKK